jgi:ribonuclease HII
MFLGAFTAIWCIFKHVMGLKSSFGNSIEAGCDEVGRGCLAGPVVAAAVILPNDYRHDQLTDSKQLNENQREAIKKEIIRDAVCWAIGVASPGEIDEINILNASYLAMHRAIDQLKMKPELLLIDGNRYKPHNETPFECIVKGDRKYLSIAAASVLAKTYRDDLMKQLAIDFPEYGWETNVGYPTAAHRNGIRSNGTTPHHRKSFQLLPDQLSLFD